MSFNWDEYYHLSIELTSSPSTLAEAKYRTAISRTYYCIFNIAKMHLKKSGIAIPTSNTHKFVIDKYYEKVTNCSDRCARKMCTQLKNMRNKRNKADYDDDYPNIDQDWQYVENMALTTKSLIPQIRFP